MKSVRVDSTHIHNKIFHARKFEHNPIHHRNTEGDADVGLPKMIESIYSRVPRFLFKNVFTN